MGIHKTLDLVSQIKLDFLHLRSVLPSSVLIFFSEIVPRLKWLIDPVLLYLEKIRRRVNRLINKFMPSVQGFSYRHTDLEGGLYGLYRPDMVHLSDIGLDIFNLDLQTCVELAVARVGCHAI